MLKKSKVCIETYFEWETMYIYLENWKKLVNKEFGVPPKKYRLAPSSFSEPHRKKVNFEVYPLKVIFDKNVLGDPFLLKCLLGESTLSFVEKLNGGKLRDPQNWKYVFYFYFGGFRKFAPLPFWQFWGYFQKANFVSRKGFHKAFWWQIKFKA